MNKTDSKHMARAIALAETSDCAQRHGCVIAHGPRVLAVGVNTQRNSPDVCADPATQAARHAEINALRMLTRPPYTAHSMKHSQGIDFSALTLYSARVLVDGTPALAKPCAYCDTLIGILGFKKVLWTTNQTVNN